ncbi:hypothetical protein [Streptomyces sp. XM4011]|uniref:hypothetical protein n=1 Tax=Streptomyces sp. XM4011 TaxID=2929780 RepID=UPI001FF7E8C8|nr:hypothetical protein [Streptomyces sp. XM4011]
MVVAGAGRLGLGAAGAGHFDLRVEVGLGGVVVTDAVGDLADRLGELPALCTRCGGVDAEDLAPGVRMDQHPHAVVVRGGVVSMPAGGEGLHDVRNQRPGDHGLHNPRLVRVQDPGVTAGENQRGGRRGAPPVGGQPSVHVGHHQLAYGVRSSDCGRRGQLRG